MTTEALFRAVQGEPVEREHAARLLRTFAEGQSSTELLAAFLTALHIRGESAGALLGFVEVLREHMIPIDLGGIPAIDLCGTGGDGQHTVNLSTAAAFVVAAAGVPVAKHGNHGVSSRTGSADVLEALGVPYKLGPAHVADMVRRLDLGFIYAPAYHPLFARIGPVRRLLGFRTAFNLLGPLCNPAGVSRQVIGVPSSAALQVVSEVVAELGMERAMVLHTPGPYDEASLTAAAQAILVERGRRQALELPPEAFGAEPIEPATLVGSDAEGNARRITAIFQGERGPLADAVCANAACTFFVAGRAGDLREGFELARATLEQGLALKKLRDAQAFVPQEASHVLAV
ncbi:MAG TPA: anthranilate phosphoribosyltransferase [Holophaga sp.]|nr:anthranilate phosphoribosyltransferase [Holophaga sp.]HPS66426.1 anthranilate phosphoribosyltransferase [Holophaga sp.]